MSNWNHRYGPWALVTGASDGIGLAFARHLAALGLNLILVARREAKLNDLASELEQTHGVKTLVVPADLSTQEGCEAVEAGSQGYDVGLFVAAAGFGTSGAFLDNNPAVEMNMVEVNCVSVVRLTHHFASQFVERGSGGLVLLSSIVAFQGVPRAANYAASKAFVQTFAEGLRTELAPHGVDVITSAPGPVASGFAERANMVMGKAERPATVAAGTVRHLGKRMTVRPGFLSKLLGYSLMTVPRWGRTTIMTQVMGGMTQHQTSTKTKTKAAA